MIKYLKREKSTINLFERHLHKLKVSGGITNIYHLNRLDILIGRLSGWYSKLTTQDVFQNKHNKIQIDKYNDFIKYLSTNNTFNKSINNDLFGIIVESEFKVREQHILDTLNSNDSVIDKINSISDILIDLFQTCIKHALNMQLAETKDDTSQINICDIRLNDQLVHNTTLSDKLFKTISKLNNQNNLIILDISYCNTDLQLDSFINKFNIENEIYLQIDENKDNKDLISNIDREFLIINETQLSIMMSYWVSQNNKLKTSILEKGLELIHNNPNILKTGVIPEYV